MIPLKKADAESIYMALVKCLKDKNLQIGSIIRMGFDGAATFSGKKTGVQARLKKHASHAVFVHCHCHILQLACVQASNSTNGIKNVYIIPLFGNTSITLRKEQDLFQRVLELPELKVIKPSDIRWLAHKRCVKAVKASYTALVVTLDSNHQNFHEPEALGLYKHLSQFNTVASLYLLDYTLPVVAKLSKSLQTKQLDLSMISGLVEAVLRSLDDAITQATNWVLELLDSKDDLEQVTGLNITTDEISRFQEKVGPFNLKNISNRFSSCHHIVSALAVFDPQTYPVLILPNCPLMGRSQLKYSLIIMGKTNLALH